MSGKRLSQILTDAMVAKHFSVERLQANTNIPSHYLESLLNEGWEDLPARPYVRGYLIALAGELGLDEKELLSLYKKERFSASGSSDLLPGNRFALPRVKLKLILIPLAILALLIYIITFSVNSRTPYLELINPERQSDPVLVNSPTIELEGIVESGDNVFVSGEQIPVDERGRFSYEYSLQPGLNTIEFRVKRFLGKEIRVLSQVVFERIQFPEFQIEQSTSSQELKEEGNVGASEDEVIQ